MENEKESQFIRKIYREVLRDEITRVDFKREKKDFIDQHFSREPLWILRPTVFVPALSLCLVLLVIQFAPVKSLVTGLKTKMGTTILEPTAQETSTLTTNAVSESVATDEGVKLISESAVTVRSVRSDVGPVMVYQKQAGEVPITIVWVFTPKESTGL